MGAVFFSVALIAGMHFSPEVMMKLRRRTRILFESHSEVNMHMIGYNRGHFWKTDLKPFSSLSCECCAS